MKTTLLFHRILFLSLAAIWAESTIAAPPQRTMTVDPVELVAGREVPGKADFTIAHEGIEYQFASSESKATFAKEPEKYAVVDGGACGRMGPLSGLGDARRYAVHEGRIYFFASDGCREKFLKDPAKHIETDDPMPFGSHEQVLQGRASLDKMVAWVGSVDRVRAVSTYRTTAARNVKQGDTDWIVKNETAVSFPDRYFQMESWNESWFSTISGPEGGAMASRGSLEPIATSRCRAFKRSMARWPIVIVKAYVDGAPKTDCPGFVVIGDGEGKIDGVPVEFVKVWMNGSASRLTIEKATGRLMQLAFQGRDSTNEIGNSLRSFTKYSTVDGITLPVEYSVTFDGKALASASAVIDSFEINPTLPADLFKVTK